MGDKNDMNGLAGKTQLLRCTTFVASRRSTYLVLARLASSRATTDCYVLYVMNKWPLQERFLFTDDIKKWIHKVLSTGWEKNNGRQEHAT